MVRRRNRRNQNRGNAGFSRKSRAMATTRPDLKVISREIQSNYTLSLNTSLTASNSNIGNTTIKITPNSLAGYDSYKDAYEQYRISNLRIYAGTTASPHGPEQTVADSISTLVTSAIDFDAFGTLTGSLIREYANARTMALGSGLKLLANFRPRVNNLYNPKVVFAPNTWLDTADTSTEWKGLRILAENVGGGQVYSSPSTMQKIYILVRATVEFRGMKGVNTSSLETEDNEQPELTLITHEAEALTLGNDESEDTYDLSLSHDELRTSILTGAFHPIEMNGINVGNIGYTVTDSMLDGVKFRRQSDMTYFEIEVSIDSMVHCNQYTV